VKALGDNGISYVTWLCAALPIVLLGIFVAWAVVLRIWRPFPDETYVIPVPGGDRSSQEEDELAAALLRRGANAAAHQNFLMSDRVEKVLVLATCLATIILWCIPADLTFGDTGVIALIPIVIFFGMGVLRKDDFNSLSWHLLFLLGGGNMLGVCARESGLLDAVVNLISPFLQTHTNFAVVSVLIVCVAVVTTFVSHTVAALILMPVVVQIASVNPNLPSASALVFMCVIMCSGSMAFPITSFPNVNSLLAEDEHGKPYLVPKHFLLAGSILSSMCVASLITFMLPMTQALLPK
jgi:di/tricarboxylate transporter